MKKIILVTVMTFQVFFAYAQLSKSEKQSIDALLNTGRLNSDQVNEIRKKLNTNSNFEYKANTSTGEISISDTLIFSSRDKKVIYQRCLEWIAINYGALTHNDLETGKIIANGLLDITHYSGVPTGFGGLRITQIQTPTNYSMILTIKDNKIKYTITNIIFNFKNFSETIDEISYPISALYSDKIQNQDWIKFLTVLNASSEMFYNSLKNSLENYINDVVNDYNF